MLLDHSGSLLGLEHRQHHAGGASSERAQCGHEAEDAKQRQCAEHGVARPDLQRRGHMLRMSHDAGMAMHSQLGKAGCSGGAEAAQRVIGLRGLRHCTDRRGRLEFNECFTLGQFDDLTERRQIRLQTAGDRGIVSLQKIRRAHDRLRC